MPPSFKLRLSESKAYIHSLYALCNWNRLQPIEWTHSEHSGAYHFVSVPIIQWAGLSTGPCSDRHRRTLGRFYCRWFMVSLMLILAICYLNKVTVLAPLNSPIRSIWWPHFWFTSSAFNLSLMSLWFRGHFALISWWFGFNFVGISPWFYNDFTMILPWYCLDIALISHWYHHDFVLIFRSNFSSDHYRCKSALIQCPSVTDVGL